MAGALIDSSAMPQIPVVDTVVGTTGAPALPHIWGTTNWHVWNSAPCEAVLRNASASGWEDSNCNYVGVAGGSGNIYLGWQIHVPSGASVQYAIIYFNQTVLSDPIAAGFWKTSAYGNGTLVQVMAPTATTSGDTYQQFGPFSETIDNEPLNGYTYAFLAFLQNTSRIYKMSILYLLQVSPAPVTPTFADVPTGYWAFQHIEALAASGITAGCGGGNFCPETYVKRSEMAVFLSKALGLSYPY